MAAQVFDFDAPLPERLYWDASFLVHAVYPAGRYHRECYAFLERLNDSHEVLSYVSTLTLDEAIFALIQLKVAEGHPAESFWDIYHENPRAIQPYLAELRRLVGRLLADPRIQIVGLEPAAMLPAVDYMERYALLPRDALHLVTMDHHGIDAIVTMDGDFLPVDGLRIFTCNPRLLAQR